MGCLCARAGIAQDLTGDALDWSESVFAAISAVSGIHMAKAAAGRTKAATTTVRKSGHTTPRAQSPSGRTTPRGRKKAQ